jgi:hypothetical protein
VATLRSRYAAPARIEYVARSDGDEITVSGQNITINADSAAISEAEDSTTTLADVAALGVCFYWVDIWDTGETEVLMRIQGVLEFTDGASEITPTGSASAVTVNISDATATTVTVSGTGADGVSAYLYIGYASDDDGTGYSATPAPGLDYVAFLSSDTEIATPTAADFTGLWLQTGGGGAGDLLAANNLSDLANAATARTNLGLGTAATTAAADYANAAQGAKADTAIQPGNAALTDSRTPTAHASSHVDGTDDIQSATNAQKGLATAAHITALEAATSKLEGIEANAKDDQTGAEIQAL